MENILVAHDNQNNNIDFSKNTGAIDAIIVTTGFK